MIIDAFFNAGGADVHSQSSPIHCAAWCHEQQCSWTWIDTL